MADTTTPVYSFVLPEIDGSDGTWGTKLNSNLTALDGLLSGSANLQNASFTGTASFGGSTGTAGQVLKSQGAGANAIWTDDTDTTYTAGSGLSLTGTEFANTAPDQTVVMTGSGATSVSGTYPNFTIASTNTTYSVGDGGLTEINFTSADNTKLDGIESGATADQTAAEIKTAYESNSDTNAFTDSDSTKLSGIEASADVTDTANVTAAGALMDSELTAIASVKALNQGVATTDSPTFVNLTLSGTGSVKVPSGTTAQRDGSPANGMFRYNSTNEQFEGYQSGDWGAIGGGGGSNTFTADTFTGNGSTTAYALSQVVNSEDNLLVFIAGVFQQQSAYSIATASGTTTLTFATAPANTREIIVYSVASAVSGSNLNIDSMTGDGSDTTLSLTINPVNENNTQVFIDGVYQNKDTYSISGTTLTFSTAPPTGSAVEVMTMTQTEINVPVDGTITPAKIASGDFYFDTNTLYVDSTNNRVGIGTASPATALDTNGIVRAESAYSLSYSGVAGATSSFGAGTISADANWGMFFKSTTGASVAEFAWYNAAGSERMRIDPSGKVGIGTSSPSAKLTVSGTGVGAAIDWTNTTASTGRSYRWVSLNNGTGFAVEYLTAGAERMRIDGSGNLLVGNTDRNTIVSNGASGVAIGGDGFIGASRTNASLVLNREDSDGNIAVFRKDGTTVGSISTNANSLPSDRNFKRNIQDLTLGLDFVESLNPVTYNFKIDDEGQAVMTGLIAQEVEEALTAAGVEKNSMTLLQHTPTDDVKESDYQMDYLKMVPILINSIKEQQTLIESQATAIADLTTRLTALENN